nr:hypothetical protein [Candidatus Woesearchaeota archaeon]
MVKNYWNDNYIIKDIEDYKIYSKHNSNDYLEVIINKIYQDYNLKKSITPSQPTQSSGINWGRRAIAVSDNAYVQPTQEEVQRVLEAVHMIRTLPEDQQRRLTEATREIRYFFDGQIRATFGGAGHFNAIRCLNDPTRTDVATPLSLRNTQLAGEEFFALNRFMLNYPDIADLQWWAVYQDGSWNLDTWNPEGEHLDTGFNGWGNLVGSVMKVNGKVLSPNEMLAFYRTMRLRNERNFIQPQTQDAIKTFLLAVDSQSRLPSRYDEQVETAIDLGLVGEDGKVLTYIGKSMITPVTARQRKQRQLTETNLEVRRIIVPTIFN